jgi:ATP-dependent DNA helicase PIF1
MRAINIRSQDNCFFLDGPGGSGKTFLYNTLMSVLRGKGKIVIPVASTGIAATLLSGGRTYHSQFKLPIPLKENSVSNMRGNSEDAKLLKGSSLIIWDEATMATHHALDAVDRLLRDLIGNDSPFGGKVILLGGGFRQCLPVVKHANRVVIVQSSIKYSRLWPTFQQLKLERNMRAVGGNKGFFDLLIRLGDGRLKNIDENYRNSIKVRD